MKINESVENYLETILMLGKKGAVRSIDIADELNFARASVRIAMKKLRAGNYILVDDSGYITLTPLGAKIAKEMAERHTELTNWLISRGVDKATAAADACKIEHVISQKSFDALKSVCKDCPCKIE
jgi:Mn-dependent DtxR family transcriptional regulator